MSKLSDAKKFYEMHRSWLGDGGRPVPKEQSQSRADVCLRCPMNDSSQPLYEAVAGVAADFVRKQIEYKNSMQLRVEGEKSLHVCAGCNCVLRLKVHVPIEHIKATTDIEDLHQNCWIRKELQ